MARDRHPFALAVAFMTVFFGFGPVEAVQVLTVDTVQVSLGTAQPLDYDTGHIEKLSANTLTISSDIDWKLTVTGTSSLWSCTGAQCWGAKPREEIEWRISGGTYAPLTGVDATVATGASTVPGIQDVVTDYRVRLDWTTDAPGTYDYGSVRYVLSAL